MNSGWEYSFVNMSTEMMLIGRENLCKRFVWLSMSENGLVDVDGSLLRVRMIPGVTLLNITITKITNLLIYTALLFILSILRQYFNL